MILLYAHSGSNNHGCEAIVRSFASIYTKEKILLLSADKTADAKFGLNDICEIIQTGERLYNRNILWKFVAKVIKLLFKNEDLYWVGINKNLKPYLKDISKAISIGGDNYCYNMNSFLSYQNKFFNKRKIKTILFGASINENALSKPIIQDLRRYEIITARESLTYSLLQKNGLNNVVGTIDSAFFLDAEKSNFSFKQQCIGINLSPLIFQYNSDKSIVINCFKALISHILDETTCDILFIPHVNIANNSDEELNKTIFSEFDSNRLHLIPNAESLNCKQLKYIISKCEMIVACRTHVSIAAYSTSTPCLVIGYSIKSRGIAKDIFGTSDGYVIDATTMNSNSLIFAFDRFYMHRRQIKEKLSCEIGQYKKRFFDGDL